MSEEPTAGQRVALAVEAGGTEADAEAHGAPYASVKLGRVIRERSPETFDRLLRGEVGVTKAYKVATKGELPTHPAADIFPMMSAEERAGLKADIERGYDGRHPILRHRDGRIIDGRNRASVCAELGIDCPSVTFDGPDEGILAMVLRENLHRRQLSASQRAMVAAKMANLLAGQKKSPSSADRRSIDLSHADAAKALNVGTRTVERAAAVLKSGDRTLIQEVASGKKKLEEASRALGKPSRKSPTPMGDPGTGSRRGRKERPPPVPPKPYVPKNPVEHLALQFSNIINALDDMAREIGPADLLAGFPEPYLKNLRLSLEGAATFLSAVRSLRSATATREATAGGTAAVSNGHDD